MSQKQTQKHRAQREQMDPSINEGVKGRSGGGTQEGRWGPEPRSLGFSRGIGGPREVSEKDSNLLWKAPRKKIPKVVT